MDSNKDQKKHSDYLDNFLQDKTHSDGVVVPQQSGGIGVSNDSFEYIAVDLDILPAGRFYKRGTQVKIRAAKVFEVQAYSTVDDTNVMDITDKMNLMLSSCVRYIHPDGSIGSYKNVKDADRIFLIFMIRELTFQGGNSLAKDVTCESCKHEFKIVYRTTPNSNQPKTFVNYDMPEELEEYYDNNTKTYKLIIGKSEWRIAPPSIGIQECFFADLKAKVADDKTPNVSFLKIIPYLLHDRDKITPEGIEAKEKEFKAFDMETFQVLNQAVDFMKFGIRELKMKCSECGSEVHSPMTFPKGASNLFVVPDYFNKFNKK